MQVTKVHSNTNFAGELSQFVTVIQNHGIHTRPAHYIVKLLELSDKDIFLYSKRVPSIKLKPSLMEMLILEIQKGDKIELVADKRYPKRLFKAIGECFGAKDVKETQSISEKFIENYKKTHNKPLEGF